MRNGSSLWFTQKYKIFLLFRIFNTFFGSSVDDTVYRHWLMILNGYKKWTKLCCCHSYMWNFFLLYQELLLNDAKKTSNFNIKQYSNKVFIYTVFCVKAVVISLNKSLIRKQSVMLNVRFNVAKLSI